MKVIPTIVTLPPDAPLWKSDPFRPLNRRAIDAARLVAGRSRKWSSEADPWVSHYADYLRLARTATEQGTEPPGPEFAAIKVAHELAQRADPRRWQIEARLVGGQSDAEIAAICGLTPDVILWFEALHFNVRQSLRAWAYILMHCVGPGRLIGFRGDELAQFWRWATLAAGPLFLDRLIDALHTALKPNEAPTLAVYLRHDAAVALDLQAFVASAVLPHFGPAGKAWERSTLLMREADASPDPDRRAFLRERAQKYFVCCARACLAGKPLPKFCRPPARTAKRSPTAASNVLESAGARQTIPCCKPSATTWANLSEGPQCRNRPGGSTTGLHNNAGHQLLWREQAGRSENVAQGQ